MRMNKLTIIGLGCLLSLAAACGDDDDNGTADSGNDATTQPDATGDATKQEDATVTEDAKVGDAAPGDATVDAAAKGDFTLTLASFTPHAGQQFVVTVRNEDGDVEVGTSTVDAVAADEVIVIAGIIEAGASYTVNFYADLNGNKACDAPDADHVWSLTGQTPDAGALSIEFPHNGTWVDVCDKI